MQVGGGLSVALPRHEVFERVSKPEFLASCIPGCKDLRAIGESERYAAVLQVQLGFIPLRFDVVVALENVVPPERLGATIQGKPKGMVGELRASAQLELTVESEAVTGLRYTLEFQLGGKLAGMGESVVRVKADEMGKQFAKNLASRLG